MGILRHFFELDPLGHEAAVRFLSVEGNQFMFLDKFMLGTALSLTLGMTCVVLALLVSMRAGRWNWSLSFHYAVLISGTVFLHLIMGVTVAAAITGTMLVLAIVGPRGRTEDGDLTVGRQALITALALAVTIPYVVSVMPRHDGQPAVRLVLQQRQIIGVIAAVLAAFIPASWYLAHLRREHVRGRRGGLSRAGTVAVWATFVAIAAFVVDLPTVNEGKFAYPLHLALTALAAGAFNWTLAAGPRVRAAIVGYVLMCTVPITTVYFVCAFADDSTFSISDSEQSVYDWIEKTTDEEALFLEDDDIVRVPVLAARDQYWGTEKYALDWNYPEDEMNLRRALRDAVFGRRELNDEVLAHARELGRPMYVILRDIHADGGVKFQRLSGSPYLTGKYMTESIAVFQVRFRRNDQSDHP